MNNGIKVNGLVVVDGMKFHDVEGGFGEGKKSMLAIDIANIHGREVKHINELINNNRTRFKDHLDIIDFLSPSERLRDFAQKNGLIGSNRTEHVYLLSERGYSKLLKIMDDDLAWEKYDELVDGYFNMRKHIKDELPQDYLSALKALVASEEEKLKIKQDADHKQEVIEGLTEDITLAEKRARINQIVRYGHTNYRERFNTLYSEFEKKYHKDIKKRMKNAIDKKKVRKSISKLEYVCEVMNMTNELYELTCKIFENDVDKVVSEFKNGIN